MFHHNAVQKKINEHRQRVIFSRRIGLASTEANEARRLVSYLLRAYTGEDTWSELLAKLIVNHHQTVSNRMRGGDSRFLWRSSLIEKTADWLGRCPTVSIPKVSPSSGSGLPARYAFSLGLELCFCIPCVKNGSQKKRETSSTMNWQ